MDASTSDGAKSRSHSLRKLHVVGDDEQLERRTRRRANAREVDVTDDTPEIRDLE